tara:strand:+ start:4289 stop:4459 length:171 start_codon:yes stop_codon:yes gene_type:complete
MALSNYQWEAVLNNVKQQMTFGNGEEQEEFWSDIYLRLRQYQVEDSQIAELIKDNE